MHVDCWKFSLFDRFCFLTKKYLQSNRPKIAKLIGKFFKTQQVCLETHAFFNDIKFLSRKFISRRPFPVMVWEGICKTGKTPLVFIKREIKINAQC